MLRLELVENGVCFLYHFNFKVTKYINMPKSLFSLTDEEFRPSHIKRIFNQSKTLGLSNKNKYVTEMIINKTK